MSNRNKGFTFVVIGAVMLLVAVSADFIGLGDYPDIFGWKQLLGVILGLALILVGVWFVSRKTE